MQTFHTIRPTVALFGFWRHSQVSGVTYFHAFVYQYLQRCDFCWFYTESTDANGTNDTGQGNGKGLSPSQRAAIVDILKQKQYPQRDRSVSVPDTAVIRNHITAKKARVPLPVQHSQQQQHQQIQQQQEQQQQQQQQQQLQQRPTSAEQTTATSPNPRQQPQEPEPPQEEYYTNIPGYDASNDDDQLQQDDYENIEVVVKTAEVIKAFDDVIAESDVTPTPVRRPPTTIARQTSHGEPTDMMSIAEHAKQKLMERRTSRESSASESGTPTESHNGGTGVVHRPVAQQRAHVSSDPQSDQFKEFLAAKVANRKMAEEAAADQNGRTANQPVPSARPVIKKTVSVDEGSASAGKGWRQPPSVKQKPRLDGVNTLQPSKPRPVQHQLPPSPPSSLASAAEEAQMMGDDFDLLPPPPEEYSNLPPMNSKPPAAYNQPLSDWQRETAGKFRHPLAKTVPFSVAVDNHDLPPPPSGFHDEVSAHPAASRAQPSRQTSADGLMSDWSCDDVVRWLTSLKMPEHGAAFTAGGINGRKLIQLTEDDFFSLGVKQFGHRRMLRRAVESRADEW